MFNIMKVDTTAEQSMENCLATANILSECDVVEGSRRNTIPYEAVFTDANRMNAK